METGYCKQDDSIFPQLLKDIKKPPEGLFYLGDINIVNEMQCLAIVGSRSASENGLQVAYELGKIAAENGFVVVNGLAIGCDTEALLGALSVNGKCAAVLPGGLDEIYPKSNKSLSQENIRAGGCLISEYDYGVRPQKNFFIDRDRLQNGLSQGVVVVETGEKGGTMHTIDFAASQGRRLGCYYSKIQKMLSGNQMIIDNHIGVPIENKNDMVDFIAGLKNQKIEHYEQLSLNVSI